MTDFELGYDYCLWIILDKMKELPNDPLRASVKLMNFIRKEHERRPRERQCRKYHSRAKH